jgi:hypothetical protein
MAPHIWPRSRIGCAVYSCCAQCQKVCRVYEFGDRERSNEQFLAPQATGKQVTRRGPRPSGIALLRSLTKIGILLRRACVHMAARLSPHWRWPLCVASRRGREIRVTNRFLGVTWNGLLADKLVSHSVIMECFLPSKLTWWHRILS